MTFVKGTQGYGSLITNKKKEAFYVRICMCDSSKFSQIFCVKFAVFTHAVIITTKMPVGRFSHCDNIAEVKKL